MINPNKQPAQHIDSMTTPAHWFDWKWHIKHSIRDVQTVQKLLNIEFSEQEKDDITQTLEKFPLSITPYYLSLIDRNDYKNDPCFRQSFPSPKELHKKKYDIADPLAEDKDSPVPFLTHRYPDRVLFHVSNTCSMYCRHCTRKRKVGDVDSIPNKGTLAKGLKYIRAHKEIRDVLVSGGDPLMLPNSYLNWILSEIRAIPHVEIIRLGTRMPVVLPFRIDKELVSMLKKHHPLYINTHFNHPREITASASKALGMLADAGIPLGNQTVLLAGINDCPRIIKKLCYKLTQNRVRPYYLYQCDLSEGLSHLRTPVGKGMEIMESLIGHISGLAVPTYVIDAPGGGGKIPVMPNYLLTWSTNKVVLRNFEGVISTYQEPDSYVPKFCERNCAKCNLQLNLEGSTEVASLGISKLLSDVDKTIVLVPKNNQRMARRK